MCGIVGIAGDLTQKDRDLFEDLLVVCQLRGRDSTGAIRVDRQGNSYTWAKRVGPPEYLIDSREYEREIRSVGISALVGHCRHKTVGAVDIQSAHPFDIAEKGIVGVHNGTLKNFYRFSEHQTGMVDSQVLYERLAAHGPETTFSDLEGAWACVWWDQNEQALRFIRNGERPLYYTYSEDKRRVFWASEPWMFGAIYRKEKLWDGGKEKQIYRQFEEDVLYTLHIDANAPKDKPVFKVGQSKKIPKKEPPARSFTPVGFQGTGHFWKKEQENKGGEVTSPFLNDELPPHLLVSAKPTETTTSKSNESSSTPSKFSLVQSPPSTSSETSSTRKNSQAQTSSEASQKTNRKKLSVVSGPSPESGSEPFLSTVENTPYHAHVGVDTRYIRAVDTEYITDRRTRREIDEHTFKKETGGKCCHCDSKIVSLKEVHEIFDEGKRFICTSCVTPAADRINEVWKELA